MKWISSYGATDLTLDDREMHQISLHRNTEAGSPLTMNRAPKTK